MRLDLITELRLATRQLPLVLHGGSGVTPADLTAAVRVGIRKVNISTEIHAAFVRGLGEVRGNDPRPALRAALASGRPTVIQVPMENAPTPTPGHWDINDIYRRGE